VDEVDLHAVDRGRELRQRVEPRLALAPVVVLRPVARELLQRRALDALGAIPDELLRGPSRRRDPLAELGDLRLRDVHSKRPDLLRLAGDRRGLSLRCGLGHGIPLGRGASVAERARRSEPHGAGCEQCRTPDGHGVGLRCESRACGSWFGPGRTAAGRSLPPSGSPGRRGRASPVEVRMAGSPAAALASDD
jgi:hypothetical protein